MRPLALLLRAVVALTSALALATAASAQIAPGDHGFRLVSAAGTFGPFCRRAATCTPAPASAATSELVLLEVRGPRNAAFVVFVAPTATWCVNLPGIFDALVLSPPWYFLLASQLLLPDPVLSCPGGLQRIPIQLPAAQGNFAMQGIVWAGWQTGPAPTFTVALDVAVR